MLLFQNWTKPGPHQSLKESDFTKNMFEILKLIPFYLIFVLHEWSELLQLRFCNI